ncbi:MAG: MFS transporter, partial [Bacillota bacterium]|nr:MFS transporter [Bacillota bacterium]
YSFMMQFNITTAIWVLYLSYKGISLVEIGLLESIFHITGLLFEIPTGAIADIYGKKLSVLAGRLLSVISVLMMIKAGDFWQFAAAFVISAASYNLESGAGEALVYDSLKETGQEDKYKRIWGNLAFFMSIAQGLAVLLGGILADIRFIYAYILGAVIQVIAFITAMYYTEPSVRREEYKEGVLLHQIKTSVLVLKGSKIVLYLILFSALSSSLGTTVYFYSQKYFDNMRYSKTAIAFIFAGSSLLSAFSSKLAHRLEKRLKIMKTLILISVLNVSALFGLAFIRSLSVIFFILVSVTDGLSFPIMSDYINCRIPSENRATLLSTSSLCFSLFMIGIFPMFGLQAEKIGFSASFGIAGGIFIPFMYVLLLKIKSSHLGGKIYD